VLQLERPGSHPFGLSPAQGDEVQRIVTDAYRARGTVTGRHAYASRQDGSSEGTGGRRRIHQVAGPVPGVFLVKIMEEVRHTARPVLKEAWMRHLV